ncbi:profilin [Phlyctochytrium arcticum]|nr:profilin [Phlyctochytrium arcticum]
MSWQSYVDDNLMATGKFTNAAIYGHDGSQWATSKDFTIPTAEIKTLINGFSHPEALTAAGIRVNNVKYFTLRADDRSVYGKQGAGGIIAVKTKQAVLVTQYNTPVQPGEATKVVEALADYLISVQYVRTAKSISKVSPTNVFFSSVSGAAGERSLTRRSTFTFLSRTSLNK